MPYTWPEYFDWLHEKQLKWPQPPPIEPVVAQPAIEPLPGIQVILWDLYGTLLRISDGELKLLVDDELRMQIAIEKTLEEFAMWQSMTRKPGAPWKYLLSQYEELRHRLQLKKRCPKGDTPFLGLSEIWGSILDRLLKKEFTWDRSIHGSQNRLASHIGFFYHQCLQGVEIDSQAPSVLNRLSHLGITQAVFADAEDFSLPHFFWLAERATGESIPTAVFDAGLSVISNTLGLRKTSLTFYNTASNHLSARHIAPHQVLYVSTRVRGDLEQAKKTGWRTALLADDRLSLRATKADLQDPLLKPDRLLTSLDQIIAIVSP